MASEHATQHETVLVCRECGARFPPGKDRCWLCGAEVSEETVRRIQPPALPPRLTFGVGSLFLYATLAAVCFGLVRVAPGLAVILLLLPLIPLLRGWAIVRRRRRAGQALGTLESLVEVAGTLAVLGLIGLASLTAFVITCFPIGLAAFSWGAGGGGGLIVVAVVAGIGAGFGVAIFLIYKVFDRKR